MTEPGTVTATYTYHCADCEITESFQQRNRHAANRAALTLGWRQMRGLWYCPAHAQERQREQWRGQGGRR